MAERKLSAPRKKDHEDDSWNETDPNQEIEPGVNLRAAQKATRATDLELRADDESLGDRYRVFRR
jgi:hypothetical protein